MQTLPTPDPTPAKQLLTTTSDPARATSYTPTSSPLQRRVPLVGARATFQYDQDATGDDYPSRHLLSLELVQLSEELAEIFRPLCPDYVNVSVHHTADSSLARRLLKRDAKAFEKRHQTSAIKVQQNTILRAFTLFSLCSKHATQYLDHDIEDRLVWLNSLNTSAVWVKPEWERSAGHRMLDLMEQNYWSISAICSPETVYNMVHNSYFLMLFARYEDPELMEELARVGAEQYSWQDLPSLRRRWFCLRTTPE